MRGDLPGDRPEPGFLDLPPWPVDDRLGWSARVDWGGMAMFVLALAVAVSVVIVVATEVASAHTPGNGVLAHAVSGVLGAMIGAVSTYAGAGGFAQTRARHRREGS